MVRKEVERTQYLEKLEQFRDKTKTVKIITGVRRCGKSTLLAQYVRRLISSGISEDRIIWINMESHEFYDLIDHKSLEAYVYPKIPKDGNRRYLFIDEIQRVEKWELVVNALMVDRDVDIYLTGSNAHLLSSELGTYLTGRHTTISMLPLSFAEFRTLHGNGNISDEMLFSQFFKYGGFPSISPSDGDLVTRSELQDLYSSILFWDVATRGNVKKQDELDRLVRYVMLNIGNPISAANISEGLGNISIQTVQKYLNLMQKAFVLYRADRSDLKKNALSPTPKYYAVDNGLRNMSLGFNLSDTGRILENIVYLELLRRGYEVTVGRWDAAEIDFVACASDGGKEYIQVSYDISAEGTFSREAAALTKINNVFPKTIIAMSPPMSYVTSDGIRVKYAIDWLLGR